MKDSCGEALFHRFYHGGLKSECADNYYQSQITFLWQGITDKAHLIIADIAIVLDEALDDSLKEVRYNLVME